MLLNLFLVAEPLVLILRNIFNIMLSAKKKKEKNSVKNDFLSKTVTFLEIAPIVIVLSQVKLRVRQNQ